MAQPVRPDDQGALADARDLVSARAGERGCHRGDPRRLQAAVRSGERVASGWRLVRVLLTRSAPATASRSSKLPSESHAGGLIRTCVATYSRRAAWRTPPRRRPPM